MAAWPLNFHWPALQAYRAHPTSSQHRTGRGAQSSVPQASCAPAQRASHCPAAPVATVLGATPLRPRALAAATAAPLASPRRMAACRASRAACVFQVPWHQPCVLRAALRQSKVRRNASRARPAHTRRHAALPPVQTAPAVIGAPKAARRPHPVAPAATATSSASRVPISACVVPRARGARPVRRLHAQSTRTTTRLAGQIRVPVLLARTTRLPQTARVP